MQARFLLPCSGMWWTAICKIQLKVSMVVLIFLQCHIMVTGQTVKPLQPVGIQKRRINFNVGAFHQNFDSVTICASRGKTIQEIIDQQSNARVINYGIQGLASISVRGSSTSQVSALWNGMPLNNIANGIYDYNLAPVFLMDQMQIDYGGTSQLWSSGAIGAAVQMGNQVSKKNGSSFFVAANAANNIQGGYAILYGNQKSRFDTRILAVQHFNNYYYFNDKVFPKVREQIVHAKFQQLGLAHNMYFDLGKKNTLAINIWLQSTDRNLPKNKLQSSNSETQEDDHARVVINFAHRETSFTSNTRFSTSNEFLHYKNPTSLVDAAYRTTFASLEHEYFYKWKGFQINSGVFGALTKAFSKVYISNPSQNRLAVFHTMRKDFAKGKAIQFGLRQEATQKFIAPLLGQLAADWQIQPSLKIGISVNRHYRLPTINDWYWPNGGNSNLKSEQGFSQEINTTWKKNKHNFNVSIYNRNINDWILWTPAANGIWTPQNVQSVWSRGIDLNWLKMYRLKKWDYEPSIFLSVGKSTVTKVPNNLPENLHKQLIYIPRTQVQWNHKVTYQFWELQLLNRFTSKRFMTTDNTKWVPAYAVADVQIHRVWKNKKQEWTTQFLINNIFNSKYEVIQNRAMPLRNFGIVVGCRL